MLENITHREWVDKYEYSHYFSWNDCPGAEFIEIVFSHKYINLK